MRGIHLWSSSSKAYCLFIQEKDLHSRDIINHLVEVVLFRIPRELSVMFERESPYMNGLNRVHLCSLLALGIGAIGYRKRP